MLFGYGCLRVNEATYDVSYEKESFEGVPSTKDAFWYHIWRVHQKLAIWMQNASTTSIIQDPVTQRMVQR